jgi:hypothetical protein
MKNYLCINGNKTELTKEQMKQLGILNEPVAALSENGKTATIGDYEFIVLKNDKTLGTVELLLKGTIGKNIEFGKTNDYRTSDVRKVVEKFGEEIEKLVGEENLLEHTVDLTAMSGLKDFGSIKAKMSLLTFDKAREYIETLDEYKLNDWWWLATAWSTKKHDIETSTMCVAPSGFLCYDYSNFYIIGVRPFCILKSSIFNA